MATGHEGVVQPPLTDHEGTSLDRPGGATIDLALVRAVATETNRAQRSMGTRLIAVERHGVTIELACRDDLADADGGLAAGVLAALLDHACSLAALVSLDDPARFGTTISLRVDHLEAAAPGRAVQVAARTMHRGAQLVTVQGRVFHPDEPDRPLATGTCKVARAG